MSSVKFLRLVKLAARQKVDLFGVFLSVWPFCPALVPGAWHATNVP